MKRLILLGFLSILLFGCNNTTQQKRNETAEKSATVYSVDDLLANAAELEGKEVTVKGTVMHVCKQGGGRCFLMGSNEDTNIRVEAGEKIGAFSQEQMGSDLTISGIFKEVRTEADAHNPEGEHGEGEDHEDDADTEEAHRVISEAQDASEVVYFIDGLTIVKEEI